MRGKILIGLLTLFLLFGCTGEKQFLLVDADLNINDLNDVQITNPLNSQVLTYQISTGLWVNTSQAGGGGSTVYSGVTPISIDNDNNKIALNVQANSDWNGLFDGNNSQYYTDFSTHTNRLFSLLSLDDNASFDARYLPKVTGIYSADTDFIDVNSPIGDVLLTFNDTLYVLKEGDTMTGNLTMNNGGLQSSYLEFVGSEGETTSEIFDDGALNFCDDETAACYTLAELAAGGSGGGEPYFAGGNLLLTNSPDTNTFHFNEGNWTGIPHVYSADQNLSGTTKLGLGDGTAYLYSAANGFFDAFAASGFFRLLVPDSTRRTGLVFDSADESTGVIYWDDISNQFDYRYDVNFSQKIILGKEENYIQEQSGVNEVYGNTNFNDDLNITSPSGNYSAQLIMQDDGNFTIVVGAT